MPTEIVTGPTDIALSAVGIVKLVPIVLLLSIRPLDASIFGTVNVPVDGTNVYLVLVTLRPDIEPVVALVKVGYNAVAVVVSLVTVTPPAGNAADCQVVPLEVNTLPDVLGATTCKADVPLPSKTLLAASVVDAVPPAAIGKVPAANAPALVEYKALLAAANVVSPVPPYPEAIVVPFHSALDIAAPPKPAEVALKSYELGRNAYLAQVPATVPLEIKYI